MGDVVCDELYDVEEILGHRYNDRTKCWELYLQWVGYGAAWNSWQAVSDMTETELILAYLKEHSIPREEEFVSPDRAIVLSDERVSEPYLDDTGVLINQNYHTGARVVGVVYDLRGHHSFKSSLRVLHSWGVLPSRDTILLHSYNLHWYVVYYRPGSVCSWVCDGANECMKKDNLSFLRGMFGRLRPLRYNSQRGDEHCSSSAVLIILRFLQISKSADLVANPGVLTAPSQLRARLVADLNPAPSATMSNIPRIGERAQSERRCVHCNKSFFRKTLQSLRCHERHCMREA